MSQAPSSSPTTRLAPSPTGALHLGNARTFLVNWALARQSGWRVVLRIEDLDTPRTKPGADRQAIADLRWLGMDWDEGPVYQAADLRPYRAALDELRGRGLVYGCTCSRSDIARAQSAPHVDEHELRYPGTCRDAGRLDGDDLCWRLRTADEPVAFDDALAGPQAFNVQQQVGDFVLWTRQGLPAYQLAVVVDDARQGVTHVVRGDDLLRSTARQRLLYRLLQLTPLPTYLHLPLVIGSDGRRLAKRHGDTRVAAYRDAGVPATRLIALLARWCGIPVAGDDLTAEAFAERFRLADLPRSPVTCTPEDHAWLMLCGSPVS